MKKLLVAGMAVIVAALSHAAAVSWTSGKIYSTASILGGTPEVQKNTSGAYTMTVTYYQLIGEEWTAMTGLTGLTTSDTSGAGKMSTETSGFAASTTYGMDVLVTEAGSSYYIQTERGYFTTGDQGDVALKADGTGFDTAFTFDASVIGDTAGTWNVPEPTSGMLLLLGMAGLALKRKRA